MQEKWIRYRDAGIQICNGAGAKGEERRRSALHSEYYMLWVAVSRKSQAPRHEMTDHYGAIARARVKLHRAPKAKSTSRFLST